MKSLKEFITEASNSIYVCVYINKDGTRSYLRKDYKPFGKYQDYLHMCTGGLDDAMKFDTFAEARNFAKRISEPSMKWKAISLSK